MPMDFGGLMSKAPKLAPMADVPEPDGDEDGLKERVAPIAQDLLDAVRGGDVDAVADALIASHKAISSGASNDTALTDNDGDEG